MNINDVIVQVISPNTYEVTLQVGQGPRAVSTLEAQEAELQAKAARDSAVIAKSEAQAISEFLKTPEVFNTLEDANIVLLNNALKPEGYVVLILKDSEYNNAKTFRVLRKAEPISVDIDFVNNEYVLGNPEDFLEFSSYLSPQLLDVPNSSSSFGFYGAFAVDSEYFYYAVSDSVWRRIPSNSF